MELVEGGGAGDAFGEDADGGFVGAGCAGRGVAADDVVVEDGFEVPALRFGESGEMTAAVETLFFAGYGAVIVVCAWGLRSARSWSRGLVMITQLIALGLAWNFRPADTRLAAIALAVPAVVVLAAVLRPESLAALEADER